MPSTLEVPMTAHPKLMGNHPPRLNLRKAASYNAQDRGPLSSSSSRFSFNHLLFSPPPSPSLPALIPRPKKSPTHARPTRIFRLVFWLSGIVVLAYFAAHLLRTYAPLPNAIWPESSTTTTTSATNKYTPYKKHHRKPESAEIVGLPPVPSSLVLDLGWGRKRWTVYIPAERKFPLLMSEYVDICTKCQDTATTVAASSAQLTTTTDLNEHMTMHLSAQRKVVTSDSADSHFIDVKAAQDKGLLPGYRANRWRNGEIWNADDLVGVTDEIMEKPMCTSTLTFLLETPDAGLGNTLMTLWTFYGLAKKQGRAFFVDDTRWAYGKYTDMFDLPPMPDCRPPSRQEMVPCPRQASHLVVSTTTAQMVFPDLVQKQGGELSIRQSQETAFSLARDGYEALFRLTSGDADYVAHRTKTLQAKSAKLVQKEPYASSPSSSSSSSSSVPQIVGVHVRRGDRHPLEYQYEKSYIPSDTFADKAYASLPPLSTPLVVVASDDPTVYDLEEFSTAARAQERIKLATKQAIQQANSKQPQQHLGFADEPFGWEGGFYAPMFWNLGGAPAAGAPSAETLRLRSLMGRAYAMDLAVLARASDVVVCTVSATGCRLLAVMMGWERAVAAGRWVNIDGEYAWTSF